MTLRALKLKRREERRLLGGHLWVYSNEVDVDATPLASMNKGTGYVERQISGWSKRFRNAHTEDIGDYETVMAWLDEH